MMGTGRKQNYRRRRRQRQLRKKLYFCFIILGLLSALLVGSIVKGRTQNGEYRTEDKKGAEKTAAGYQIDLAHLNSRYAILTDLTDGTVLGENNSHDRLYPASLTKIMTAILVIEKTDDFSGVVTLPDEIFAGLYTQDASMAGFQPGEEVSLKDLLYGILLPSGAECCITFAQRIAGSEEAFVELMNQKADELGMKDSQFSNCTGLQDREHYTTAADMEKLLRYALGNETFRTVFTSHSYSTQPSNVHPDGITFYSTLFKYMDSAAVTGGEILGGKTGYTEEAGLCLASLASINGKEYILITAKADGSHETEQFHIMDAAEVYNEIGSI